MKLLGLLGALSVACLSACSPRVIGNYQGANFHLDNKLNAQIISTGSVSYSNDNGHLNIGLTFDNNDNIWHYENYVSSITLVAQYSYVTFFLDSAFQFNYDGLLEKINTFEIQLQEDYIFGFADLYHKDTDAGTSFIHRTYFVNPSNLGYGTYTFEDVSWSNIRANYPNAQDGLFGRWLTYQDFLYVLNMMWSDQNDNTIWNRDSYYECYVEWTTDFSATFYDISYVGAIEPQIHYSDTKVCIGNSNGYCDVNSTKLSYLPYSYMIFNADSSSMYTLDDSNTQIRFNFYAQDEAYQQGYNTGYHDGNANGYNDGYQEGYTGGYTDGNTVGYNNGYNAGASDSNTYTFGALFASIADTPVLIFRQLFSFDLFGTSALIVVMSLFTALLLIFVAKKLLK